MIDSIAIGDAIDHGEAVEIDCRALVGQRLLAQGSSGAGKSRALRLILERMPTTFQQILIDVEDEFHTLRSKERPYAILGGEYSDVEGLDRMDAGALSQAILTSGTNVIFQINEWTLEEQERFICDYLRGMMRAPRELWRPVVLLLDEAHRYAPQGGSSISHDAVYHYVSAGRKRGFSAMLATQRFSELSAGVRGLCANKLIGRVDSSLDRKTSADALGFTPSSAEAKQLDTLAAGKFWTVGPIFSEKALVQFDASETEAPAPGVSVPPAAAPGALMKALKDLPVADVAIEDDAETSRSGSGEVRTVTVKVIDQDAIAAAEKAAFAEGREVGSAETFDRVLAMIQAERDGAKIPEAIQIAKPAAATPPPAGPGRRKAKSASTGRDLTDDSMAARLHGALHWFACIGETEPSRDHLAGLLDLKPTDRKFSAGLADLMGDGIVTFTTRGVRLENGPDGLRSPGEVVGYIRDRLGGTIRAMFDVLLSADVLRKTELLKAVGVSDNGQSRACIARLLKMGLAEQPEKMRIALTPMARGKVAVEA